MSSLHKIMTYPAPTDLNRYSTHLLHIASADELPREELTDGWSIPSWRCSHS